MPNIFQNKLYFFYLSMFGFLFSLYAFNMFSMDDFHLHTEMGKWIVSHREIPYIAVGSWYGEETNLPWIAHEWLSEVLFYLNFSFWNNNVTVIQFICFILCFSFVCLIIHLNKKEMEKHYLSSFVYLSILSLSFYGFFVYRPQIFSFFLFFSEIYCLTRFRENHNKKFLIPIPFIAVSWANFHGGSSALSYVIPILFVVFNYIPVSKIGLAHKFYLNKFSLQEVQFLLLSSVGAFLGLFINPYGYRMVTYPYENMMDENMLSYILEWVPLNITLPEHIYLIFPVLFFAWFSLFQSKSKIDIVDFMFLLTFTFMTFKSGRFVMYFSIYSSFCIWKYFNCAEAPVWESQKKRVSHNIKLTVLLFMCLSLAVFYKGSVGSFFTHDDTVSRHQAIISKIVAENPKHIWNRVFHDELLVSGVKPFVDGRADAFTGEPFLVATRYIDHSFLDPEKMIEKYKFDYVLLLQSDPLMIFIRHNPEKFQLIYEESSSSFETPYKKEAMSFYRLR